MQLPSRPARTFARAAMPCACALLACGLFAASAAPQNQTLPKRSIELPPEANPVPDANQQMQMQQQRVRDQAFSAANLERKREITQETTLLLRLATEVKAAVDKGNTQTVIVMKKTELIERLAHDVQDKMKLTVYKR